MFDFIDFTDPSTRILMEQLDLLILTIPCLISGFFIFREFLPRVNARLRKPRKITGICLSLLLTAAAVAAIWFALIIVASFFRGRWCEGCMEYH